MSALFLRNQYNNDWCDAISALKADRLLGIKSDVVAKFITWDPEEILERQDIFADCIDNHELTEGFHTMIEHIVNIKDILEKERTYSKSMERTLYSVRIIEIYLDAIALAADLYKKTDGKLRSRRLREFLLDFYDFFLSERYAQIKGYVQQCLNSAHTVKSFTVGINLNTKLEPVEMGIISMNEESFVTSNFFVDMFTPSGRSIERVTPMIRFSGKNELLQRSMYLSMNDCLCKSVNKAFRDILNNIDEITHSLLNAENDLRFIYHSCKYIEELKNSGAHFCFAQTSSECSYVQNAYSPILLMHIRYNNIVANDISFDKNGVYVHILTGANSGGKSVYIQTIGIIQILFQLGLCVPASSASICPLKCVYTHFSTDCNTDTASGDSRFVSECKQMKHVIEKISEDSLLLMDESFSGTSSAEGAAVAAQVLKHICYKRCFCVYSTHIHEIVMFMDDLNRKGKVAAPMCVGMDKGNRTYKILFGQTDELSHAYDIAKKYGLEFSEE